MARQDDDIDKLYQLPLDQFTPERNALAKASGDKSIKDLQKPSVPAWAINQVYWQDRDAYDGLIDAAERLREAHRKLLGGKAVDLREAEGAHREAIRAAAERARARLTEGGQAATEATLTAVKETLEALPVAEPPGRLVRPLKPMGFEALAGIAVVPSSLRAVPPVKREQRETKKADPAAAKREAEEARRAAERAEREAEKERQRQRAFEEKVRKAEAEVKRAQTALLKAQQEAKIREAELDQAKAALERLRFSADRPATHRGRA